MRVTSGPVWALCLPLLLCPHVRCQTTDSLVSSADAGTKAPVVRASVPWIGQDFWPDASTIAGRRYHGDVTFEKDALMQILKRVFKDTVRPPDEFVRANAIGISGLRYPYDTLLLEYTAPTGHIIRVRDEARLLLEVTVPKPMQRPLAQVESLVRDTTLSILNLPETEGKSPGEPVYYRLKPEQPYKGPLVQRPPNIPLIVSSPTRAGSDHRSGEFRYGPMENRQPLGSDWYSFVGWSSDGKRVLLSIQPWSVEERERRNGEASPRPEQPRVFRSRAAS